MGYVMPLLVAALFVLAIYGIARSPLGNWGAFYFCGFGLFVCAIGMLSVLALLPIALGGVTFVCGCLRAKPRTLFISSMAVATLGSVFLSWSAFASNQAWLRRRAEMRADYPLESLADRLAYETTPDAAIPQAEESAQLASLSGAVEANLMEFETRDRNNFRTGMLERLHDRTRDEFIRASGFGVYRMRRVTREYIEVPETETIPLPAAPEVEPMYEPEPARDLEHDLLAADEQQSGDFQSELDDLRGLHRSGLDDFFEPERMGYVADDKRVAGFESHQFVRELTLNAGAAPRAQWEVTRLELVSLLKFEKPSVYVSRELPRMAELENAARRPLDRFEEHALVQLRSDSDLIVENGLNHVRMLGSLRAAKSCLECHQVQRGELLGAFSYDLWRTEPIEPKPHENPPAEPRA
jgi:hypothetical protein